ncbi:MAG: hypothetical protein NZ516_07715 [Raineya sp.]|nr:hypothetical protein [Raineya sp.]
MSLSLKPLSIEYILAILANFGSKTPEEVSTQILQKLKSLPIETFRREKCVIQLKILSKLRNLQEVIIQLLEKMALTYNIENNLRYRQGLEIGEKKD